MLVGMPLLQILDRMGCGGVILATSGDVLAINDGAAAILREMFAHADDPLDLLDAPGRELIKRLLTRAKTRIQVDGEKWILIERGVQRPLVMYAASIAENPNDGPHTVFMVIDLDVTAQPHRRAIERIFKLTPAEARLAVLIAIGATVFEAAEIQGLSVATTRSQLASVFTKTRTNRQAELFRLISRLSALP